MGNAPIASILPATHPRLDEEVSNVLEMPEDLRDCAAALRSRCMRIMSTLRTNVRKSQGFRWLDASKSAGFVVIPVLVSGYTKNPLLGQPNLAKAARTRLQVVLHLPGRRPVTTLLSTNLHQ